jgi:ABC-2 type transport system ATP-binding protein
MDHEPLLTFQDVAVLEDDVLMLDDATGAVDRGGVLALRGANGAGKTTLLRVLAGRLRPTAGTVRLAGRVPDDRDRITRRLLAAAIGPAMTQRDLSVREHLQFIAATWGADVRQAQRLAASLLEELSLTALDARFPHELSSGQTQLLALAMTLARPFELLLLDEPEQRLDADRTGLVVDAIRRRVEDGAAVVMATHSQRLETALADDSLTLIGEEQAA